MEEYGSYYYLLCSALKIVNLHSLTMVVILEYNVPEQIGSNGEASPRRFYVVKYGQNSAECHSSPSHGNILPCTDFSKRLIRQSGGQWLNSADL
jgi:hypothetical protein